MKYLKYEERRVIEELYNAGFSISEISNLTKTHISTIYREIARGALEEPGNGGKCKYSAEKGQLMFEASLKKRGRKSEKL